MALWSFAYPACGLTGEQGFDEFMNLVIDDAVEVQLATKDTPEKRRQLGRFASSLQHWASADTYTGQILLKGDNVSLIQSLD